MHGTPPTAAFKALQTKGTPPRRQSGVVLQSSTEEPGASEVTSVGTCMVPGDIGLVDERIQGAISTAYFHMGTCPVDERSVLRLLTW